MLSRIVCLLVLLALALAPEATSAQSLVSAFDKKDVEQWAILAACAYCQDTDIVLKKCRDYKRFGAGEVLWAKTFLKTTSFLTTVRSPDSDSDVCVISISSSLSYDEDGFPNINDRDFTSFTKESGAYFVVNRDLFKLYSVIRTSLSTMIERCSYHRYSNTFVFVGHGLGGALAQIAMYDADPYLVRDASLYTFSAPSALRSLSTIRQSSSFHHFSFDDSYAQNFGSNTFSYYGFMRVALKSTDYYQCSASRDGFAMCYKYFIRYGLSSSFSVRYFELDKYFTCRTA